MLVFGTKVIPMKATIDIDDALMQRLYEEAKRRQTTVLELVDAGLKYMLDKRDEPLSCDKSLPPLPKWRGELLVDISNRDELQRIWDEDASFRY